MPRYKVHPTAYGAFPSGDYVMATYHININDSPIELILDHFKTITCASCTITDKASIDRGAQAIFDIDTECIYQTAPQNIPPHISLTLIGTLMGAM